MDRWSEGRGLPTGGVLTPEQCWRLARAWFHDRLSPDWRRRTPEEATRIFGEIGLTGPFWRLG
ncbi:MAG TPA: hypothetical protein VFZ75_11095 [Actinomycetota bacterium]|nr:hypothetical protein [Actinomycetota bacterium]